MRVPTLFTLIVIGSVSAASAQPKHEEISGRVSLNEKDAKPEAARQPGDWVELASATPTAHGTEFVIVGKDAGSFGKLRIDAAKGKAIVRKVRIYFDDGKLKVVQVDKILSAKGNKSALIELGDPKLIDRIVVTTEADTKGEYALYGAVGTGSAGRVVGTR